MAYAVVSGTPKRPLSRMKFRRSESTDTLNYIENLRVFALLRGVLRHAPAAPFQSSRGGRCTRYCQLTLGTLPPLTGRTQNCRKLARPRRFELLTSAPDRNG